MSLVQHIDGIIQILLGVFFTWVGFRRSSRWGPRTTKLFKIGGPVLSVIGAVSLLRPSATSNWERRFTSDGVASVEFPGRPASKESTDTVGSAAIKRTSLTYDVPEKDIVLFLSYSTFPEDARTMTDAERIENTVAYFASQGAHVIQRQMDGTGVICRLTLRQDEKRATMQVALAYVGGNIYRAVASWTDGNEDKDLVDRFSNSFRIYAGN